MVNFRTLSWPPPSQGGMWSYMINTWEHRHSINSRRRSHWARLYDRSTTHSLHPDAVRALVTHMHLESRVLVALGVCDSTQRIEAIGPRCGQIMLIWTSLVYCWLEHRLPEQVFQEGVKEISVCRSDKEANTTNWPNPPNLGAGNLGAGTHPVRQGKAIVKMR